MLRGLLAMASGVVRATKVVAGDSGASVTAETVCGWTALAQPRCEQQSDCSDGVAGRLQAGMVEVVTAACAAEAQRLQGPAGPAPVRSSRRASSVVRALRRIREWYTGGGRGVPPLLCVSKS